MDTPETNDKAALNGAAGSTAIAVIDRPKQADAKSTPAAFSVLQIVKHLIAFLLTMFAARPRLSRVAVLAFSIVLAAVAGSLVGALAAVALVRPAPASAPTVVAAQGETLAAMRAEMDMLKSRVEELTQSTGAQFTRMIERVERAEKLQSEPATKFARLAEAVEKLDRRMSATIGSESTGSVVLKQSAAVGPKQDDRPPVVTGWVLRDIFDGAALVESRHGLYEVVPGANLPGLGRVERIHRQAGRWVVVTPKGLIVSAR